MIISVHPDMQTKAEPGDTVKVIKIEPCRPDYERCVVAKEGKRCPSNYTFYLGERIGKRYLVSLCGYEIFLLTDQ